MRVRGGALGKACQCRRKRVTHCRWRERCVLCCSAASAPRDGKTARAHAPAFASTACKPSSSVQRAGGADLRGGGGTRRSSPRRTNTRLAVASGLRAHLVSAYAASMSRNSPSESHTLRALAARRLVSRAAARGCGGAAAPRSQLRQRTREVEEKPGDEPLVLHSVAHVCCAAKARRAPFTPLCREHPQRKGVALPQVASHKRRHVRVARRQRVLQRSVACVATTHVNAPLYTVAGGARRGGEHLGGAARVHRGGVGRRSRHGRLRRDGPRSAGRRK